MGFFRFFYANSGHSRATRGFTLTIPVKHDAYQELFAIFKSALEQQSHLSTLDIEAGDPAMLMTVPFWAWRDKQRQVAKILHKHRATQELEWNWPLRRSGGLDYVPVLEHWTH